MSNILFLTPGGFYWVMTLPPAPNNSFFSASLLLPLPFSSPFSHQTPLRGPQASRLTLGSTVRECLVWPLSRWVAHGPLTEHFPCSWRVIDSRANISFGSLPSFLPLSHSAIPLISRAEALGHSSTAEPATSRPVSSSALYGLCIGSWLQLPALLELLSWLLCRWTWLWSPKPRKPFDPQVAPATVFPCINRDSNKDEFTGGIAKRDLTVCFGENYGRTSELWARKARCWEPSGLFCGSFEEKSAEGDAEDGDLAISN